MPVNPYDDRKVSLRRPHGNGDLDIVRASYTRRKANVTEALSPNAGQKYCRMSVLQYFRPSLSFKIFLTIFKWPL